MRTREPGRRGTSWRLLPMLALIASCWALAADPAKVLRVASPDIETLDPQQYNENPSFEITSVSIRPSRDGTIPNSVMIRPRLSGEEKS